MPNLSDSITGFVAGDDLEITRTITGIPEGQTLVKGWLTVKRRYTDADPGILQKIITTANVAGTGQITDDGDDDGAGAVRFDLTPEDTALLTAPYVGGSYYFDIQIMTSASKLYTPVAGTIVASPQVTQATS